MEKYVWYIRLIEFFCYFQKAIKPGDNNHWKLGFIVWTRVRNLIL